MDLTADFKKGFNFGFLCKKILNNGGSAIVEPGGMSVTGGIVHFEDYAAEQVTATMSSYPYGNGGHYVKQSELLAFFNTLFGNYSGAAVGSFSVISRGNSYTLYGVKITVSIYDLYLGYIDLPENVEYRKRAGIPQDSLYTYGTYNGYAKNGVFQSGSNGYNISFFSWAQNNIGGYDMTLTAKTNGSNYISIYGGTNEKGTFFNVNDQIHYAYCVDVFATKWINATGNECSTVSNNVSADAPGSGTAMSNLLNGVVNPKMNNAESYGISVPMLKDNVTEEQEEIEGAVLLTLIYIGQGRLLKMTDVTNGTSFLCYSLTSNTIVVVSQIQ